ncbi:hypothetical protein E2C01_009003 [Portunus trituberculatus]|uniref:Uncharacterized protein n=1 Tax=Portunus trituberculatus TaxID=210409 RepID=A0A5B7D5N5_PORTR|nr:hypothetical protein [Portunus trituberculatus]
MSEAATLAIPGGDPVAWWCLVVPGGAPSRSEYPNSSRPLNQPDAAIDGALNEAQPVLREVLAEGSLFFFYITSFLFLRSGEKK